MAVTLETNDQYAGDGFGKGLPAGINLFDTDGGVVPRISAIKPTAIGVADKGYMVFGDGGADIEIWDGSAWLSVTLT